MSLSGLTITRTFDPTVTYLRGATRVTYTFSVASVVPGVAGLPLNLTSFRDKEIKSAIYQIQSPTFKNQTNVSNNMTWSYDPALGITVTGLAGAPISFFPGNGVAKFDLTMILENGQNVGVVGPTFNNNTQYDVTMSNPEMPPYLTSSGNSWTYYNIGPPSR